MESEPVKARVTQLLGRTGSRGGITQVKVILISGKEADKRHLIRNVKGPVRIGDVLELMESEREARRLRWSCQQLFNASLTNKHPPSPHSHPPTVLHPGENNSTIAVVLLMALGLLRVDHRDCHV